MTEFLLAIDPGNEQSAFVVLDVETCVPVAFGKEFNEELASRLASLVSRVDHVVIEMVASYGMPVGKEVFETCVQIGRFMEIAHAGGIDAERLYRLDVKLHLCHDSRAKDSNVRQALVDRFAPAASNHGKGSKADPSVFYGFARDTWAAMAIGVCFADRIAGRAA